MNRLLEIGFSSAGHWLLETNTLEYTLAKHSNQRNVLYAFVSDGQVMYVGKTAQALRQRMYGYSKPHESQVTNLKNHNNIRALLAQGVAVDILALPDNGLVRFGQFHLNLAAALEDDLIRVIRPPWNGGRGEDGRRIPLSVGNSGTDPDSGEKLLPRTVDAFTFTVQRTYLDKGFFNVGVASQALLGPDGETIELFLGNEARPILGTINRRANANETPRIMGGAGLRDWFKSSASVAQPSPSMSTRRRRCGSACRKRMQIAPRVPIRRYFERTRTTSGPAEKNSTFLRMQKKGSLP